MLRDMPALSEESVQQVDVKTTISTRNRHQGTSPFVACTSDIFRISASTINSTTSTVRGETDSN